MNRLDLLDKYPCGGGETEKKHGGFNEAIIYAITGKDIPNFVPGIYCLVLEIEANPNLQFVSSRIDVDGTRIAESSGKCDQVGAYPHFTAVGFSHVDYDTRIEYVGASTGGKLKHLYKWCLVHPD